MANERVGVAVGGSSACAIRFGEVLCWGSNGRGQLGIGSDLSLSVPGPVVDLPAEAVDVVLFTTTPCALLVDGKVFCWGDGEDGQIGNGSTADESLIPQEVQIIGGAPVESLAGGRTFNCAAVSDGVQCWGDNLWGQLGNGSTTDSNVPVVVSGLGAVTELTLGRQHACAVEVVVKCWGANFNSQLSNSTITNSSVPVTATWWNPVPQSFGLGENLTCAVLVNGEAHCLGSDEDGQAGNGPLASTVEPTLMVGTDVVRVKQVASAYGRTCVVGVDGSVRCTGLGSFGRLGNGANENSEVLVNVVR